MTAGDWFAVLVGMPTIGVMLAVWWHLIKKSANRW